MPECARQKKTMAKNALFDDYEAFTEKFKPKKTTDDCYTPAPVFEAVRDFALALNPEATAGRRVIRPFWPGGDYESEDYTGGAVIDNPPFSIFSKIVRFYASRRVPFFLLAPHLTLMSGAVGTLAGVTGVVVNTSIIYENGAEVRTSFVTNFWPGAPRMVISGNLNRRVMEAVKVASPDKSMRKIGWPENVISAALAGKLAVPGVDIEIPAAEAFHIKGLNCGQQIYGAGLIVSDRVAAELRAAELRAAKKVDRYELDEREMEIVAALNKAGGKSG